MERETTPVTVTAKTPSMKLVNQNLCCSFVDTAKQKQTIDSYILRECVAGRV